MAVSREKWRKFTGWYEDVLINAEIYDHRYPLKGAGVWMPYGFLLREKVYGYLKKLHRDNNYFEVLFPTLIPEDMFRKESEHVASFEKEVFWVTRGGGKELEKKYVLRPTSETAMYPMFALWAKSYRDLPIKIYQIVNVFRYETKATHPLYREREITTFFESHCAFATKEENEKEVKSAIEMYKKFFDWLGIPYLITIRPDWDKFPGAEYTVAFDTILPNGRTLQIGTVHNLGQNFAKAFEIIVDLPDGTRNYVYQNCFGVSGRVITALIAIHGDDHGLVLPPNVAPIDVVIIPIPYKGFEKQVVEEAKKVEEILKNAGYSVILDLTDETPGAKYYKWELKGVPIRIEIGPKDLEEESVTLVRRDTLEKIRVKKMKLIEKIEELRKKIYEYLKDRAKKFFEKRLKDANSLDEISKLIEEGNVVKVDWCGEEKCGLELEEKIGFKILGTVLENIFEFEKPKNPKCINCGKNARYRLAISKSY